MALDVLHIDRVNNRFFVYAIAVVFAQTLTTLWLVKVPTYKNFALGTGFARTEAVQKALLGALLLSAYLSIYG